MRPCNICSMVCLSIKTIKFWLLGWIREGRTCSLSSNFIFLTFWIQRHVGYSISVYSWVVMYLMIVLLGAFSTLKLAVKRCMADEVRARAGCSTILEKVGKFSEGQMWISWVPGGGSYCSNALEVVVDLSTFLLGNQESSASFLPKRCVFYVVLWTTSKFSSKKILAFDYQFVSPLHLNCCCKGHAKRSSKPFSRLKNLTLRACPGLSRIRRRVFRNCAKWKHFENEGSSLINGLLNNYVLRDVLEAIDSQCIDVVFPSLAGYVCTVTEYENELWLTKTNKLHSELAVDVVYDRRLHLSRA